MHKSHSRAFRPCIREKNAVRYYLRYGYSPDEAHRAARAADWVIRLGDRELKTGFTRGRH